MLEQEEAELQVQMSLSNAGSLTVIDFHNHVIIFKTFYD